MLPSNVAPLAGARIEIGMNKRSLSFVVSLPSRERGLKYIVERFASRDEQSLPSRERGLKSDISHATTYLEVSLPSRERGLKSI